MNDATSATYEANSPETPFDSVVGRIGQPAREQSPGQVRCFLSRGKYPPVSTPARWQVREDRSFYIPKMQSDKQNRADPETFAAAIKHANHLVKAQLLVGDAMHLVRMMADALGQEGDRRAEQTDVACKAIEKS